MRDIEAQQKGETAFDEVRKLENSVGHGDKNELRQRISFRCPIGVTESLSLLLQNCEFQHVHENRLSRRTQ